MHFVWSHANKEMRTESNNRKIIHIWSMIVSYQFISLLHWKQRGNIVFVLSNDNKPTIAILSTVLKQLGLPVIRLVIIILFVLLPSPNLFSHWAYELCNNFRISHHLAKLIKNSFYFKVT